MPTKPSDSLISQCYPFLEQFEICGMIDEKTEKEKLTLTHVPTQERTSIDCFHTVLGELGEPDLSHHSDTISDLETKKAGVFGIAQFFSENGLDALKIQHSIEENTQITPWSQKILPFVAKYNQEALKKHVEQALESCIFDGKPHDPCLIANLLPFRNLLPNLLSPDQINALPDDLATQRCFPFLTKLELCGKVASNNNIDTFIRDSEGRTTTTTLFTTFTNFRMVKELTDKGWDAIEPPKVEENRSVGYSSTSLGILNYIYQYQKPLLKDHLLSMIKACQKSNGYDITCLKASVEPFSKWSMVSGTNPMNVLPNTLNLALPPPILNWDTIDNIRRTQRGRTQIVTWLSKIITQCKTDPTTEKACLQASIPSDPNGDLGRYLPITELIQLPIIHEKTIERAALGKGSAAHPNGELNEAFIQYMTNILTTKNDDEITTIFKQFPGSIFELFTIERLQSLPVELRQFITQSLKNNNHPIIHKAMCTDPDPTVRFAAAKTFDGIESCFNQLVTDPDPTVRSAIATTAHTRNIVQRVFKLLLTDPSPLVRATVAQRSDIYTYVCNWTKDAYFSLDRVDRSPVDCAFFFTDPDPTVRLATAQNSAATKLSAYAQLFTDPDAAVRQAACKHLSNFESIHGSLDQSGCPRIDDSIADQLKALFVCTDIDNALECDTTDRYHDVIIYQSPSDQGLQRDLVILGNETSPIHLAPIDTRPIIIPKIIDFIPPDHTTFSTQIRTPLIRQWESQNALPIGNGLKLTTAVTNAHQFIYPTDAVSGGWVIHNLQRIISTPSGIYLNVPRYQK